MITHATHTPGPWIIDPNPDLPLGVIMDTEEGLGICELEGNDDESRANAHLIAAAPAMYEALTHALAICEAEVELRGENDTDDYMGGAAGPVAQMIRAALAQAEGRHTT